MQGFVDYYRILQVHFQAEPEVIISAYKGLAKKYHPDLNKARNAEMKMRKINEAYEILRDSEKRKKYDDVWQKKQNSAEDGKGSHKEETYEDGSVSARIALERYFECIKCRDFENAYGLISTSDKCNISLKNFIKWQDSVSKIYHLQGFYCIVAKTDRNVVLNGLLYEQVVELIVKTVENNTIMDRLGKDIINKKVLLENEGWRVFLGYENILPYIAEFEELNELLLAKPLINRMTSRNSYIDKLTGLLSRNGFIEEAEKEIWRHERYGNIFSLMLIELDQHSIEKAASILKNNFRKLDLLGRWGETEFIVLMPETDLSGSSKAALKIMKAFEAKMAEEAHKMTVHIGVDEFKGSLEYTIGKLYHYLGIAQNRSENDIAHRNY